MKKLKEVANSRSKKSGSKAASNKKVDNFGRPRLPKDMKYRIDKVSAHPLHIGSLCNRPFGEDIKMYFREDVLGAFRNMIFGILLDLPQCNWICQITKCLLMQEIQQDNKDKIYVWMQGNILKLTMLEFSIITVLKYTGDIDEYMYTSSTKSSLMSKYFLALPGVTNDEKSTRARSVRQLFGLFSKNQEDSTDKGEIGVSEFEHRHQGELGVFPEHDQLKFVPSSSTTPEGTSNFTLDMEVVKTYINTYVDKKIVELVTLISNIPVEVFKALKNEENKESPDENMIDKEEGREEELKNKHSPDMKDLSDDVGGTITDSVQDTIDALLFDLPTPSTTKSLDVGTPNIVTKSQWTIPNSHKSTCKKGPKEVEDYEVTLHNKIWFKL
ncbi:hypothetical protein FXO38_15768 [Capsicum annuum]|nr:hypothetical protein FXO38_15768 [Capsicum annuum]KAF3666510.1 hypothetical protein FXO37_10525 [Capsicum annuum]